MNNEITAVCEAANRGWRPHSDCCGFGSDGTACPCSCHRTSAMASQPPIDPSPVVERAKHWLESNPDVPYDAKREAELDTAHHNEGYEIIAELLGALTSASSRVREAEAERDTYAGELGFTRNDLGNAVARAEAAESRLSDLQRRYEALEQEKDDLERSFKLFAKATRSLTEAWWAAHPEKRHIFPDTAKMCEWTAEQLAEVTRQRDEARGCPHGENCACALGSRHSWLDAFSTTKSQLTASQSDLLRLREALEKLTREAELTQLVARMRDTEVENAIMLRTHGKALGWAVALIEQHVFLSSASQQNRKTPNTTTNDDVTRVDATGDSTDSRTASKNGR